MDSWIDLHALWKIVVVGLAAGAGLPALFAIGLRILAPPHREAGRVEAGTVAATPAHVAGASVCFAIVLAAIGYGIYLIVAGS